MDNGAPISTGFAARIAFTKDEHVTIYTNTGAPDNPHEHDPYKGWGTVVGPARKNLYIQGSKGLVEHFTQEYGSPTETYPSEVKWERNGKTVQLVTLPDIAIYENGQPIHLVPPEANGHDKTAERPKGRTAKTINLEWQKALKFALQVLNKVIVEADNPDPEVNRRHLVRVTFIQIVELRDIACRLSIDGASVPGVLRAAMEANADIAAVLTPADLDALFEDVRNYVPPGAETEQPQPSRFAPIWINDLTIDDEPSYLIDGLLPCGPCFGVVFGPPGSLKTFVLTDAFLHIARGKEYCGRKVEKKAVIYVTSEAVVGVKRRLIAMRRYHKIEGEYVPFGIVDVMPNLGTGTTDRDELIKAIEQKLAGQKLEIGAIAIDTLRRAIPGKSENDQKDMSIFIENCEAVGRHFKCAVPTIHHSPRSSDTRSSGSNSIDAASNFMWSVLRQGTELKSIASIARMKDGADDGVSWAFDVVPVEIERRANGDAITSCHVVARPIDLMTDKLPSQQGKKDASAPRGPTAMRDALVEALEHGQIITLRGGNKVKAAKIENAWPEFRSRYVTGNHDPKAAEEAARKAFLRQVDKLPSGFAACTISGVEWVYRA
jgi:hypothetical protein